MAIAQPWAAVIFTFTFVSALLYSAERCSSFFYKNTLKHKYINDKSYKKQYFYGSLDCNLCSQFTLFFITHV